MKCWQKNMSMFETKYVNNTCFKLKDSSFAPPYCLKAFGAAGQLLSTELKDKIDHAFSSGGRFYLL